MNNDTPNPWSFSNEDKNLISPNGKYKIVFGSLYEIAMGAPVGGECFLILGDRSIKLSEWAAGPVIWNNSSAKIAIPVWTKNRNQQIAIVDLNKKHFTIYKRTFRVLHFSNFNGNILSGIDSPIYMSTNLNFEIDKETIDIIKKLK